MATALLARPTWQASLLDAGAPTFDRAFLAAERRRLSRGAWIEHQADWLDGSDELFARVVEAAEWESHTIEMYGERVPEPRLSARYRLAGAADEAQAAVPAELAVFHDLAATLGARYGVTFTSVGCNLYRDGSDGVAWHGDRIARDIPTAIIAIVSLGHRRPLRFRPRGGGAGLGYSLGRGDLLVMGGSCQRTWQHAVPKVADAGPRISVTFRHDY